jgi:hypothetical protein
MYHDTNWILSKKNKLCHIKNDFHIINIFMDHCMFVAGLLCVIIGGSLCVIGGTIIFKNRFDT